MGIFKSTVMVGLFLSFIPFAKAQECTPEATQQLGALMTKVSNASQTVDGYNRKYKIDSVNKADLYSFCLNSKSRPELKAMFDEAAPAVNDLEEFGNRQTGACKESALRASGDLERNVRKAMARLEECSKNQK